MATVTLGTSATNSLTALLVPPTTASLDVVLAQVPPVFVNAADYATVDIGILDDLNPAHPNYGANCGLTRDGRLYVPNRGFLLVRASDYIGFDATTGWPILVSARAIAAGPWTHT